LRYANAKARYDGLIQSYSDDIDGQIQAMTDHVNLRTGQDGNITLIETNTGKEAFLLSEGVVFDDEGFIDKSQVTDKPLIIIDEEGNKKMISYRDINKVIGQSNAQEHIAYQAEEIRNTVAAQVEQEANTPSQDEVQEAINNVQVEDVVQLNINNNPVTATVQSVNPNTGEIVVQLEKPILNEQGKEQRVVSFPADQFTAALVKQDNTQQATEPIQTEVAQQQAAPVAEVQTQPAAEAQANAPKVVQTEPAPVKEYPRDKEGFIDYTQITEPQDFAEALMSEFNPEDATAILDDYIAETQKAVKAAEKEKDPIKRRRKIAAEQAKAERYAQIKDIINKANEQEQAEVTTQEVVDQPEVEQEQEKGADEIQPIGEGAFGKKNIVSDSRTDIVTEPTEAGKQNDTATLQNDISDSEETTNSENSNTQEQNIQPTNPASGVNILDEAAKVVERAKKQPHTYNIGDIVNIKGEQYEVTGTGHILDTGEAIYTLEKEGKVAYEDITEGELKELINSVSSSDLRVSSSETDQNGLSFVEAKNGTTVFGEVKPESGLTPAPIKLSVGNKSYGLEHIEEIHGEQIRQAGFNDVVEFVEFVAQNYDRIQQGVNAEKQPNNTYLVQITDKYNNTLYIELSNDGSYWNVNSGGVFRGKYGDNLKTVWSASEVQSGKSVSDNTLRSSTQADNLNDPNGTISNTDSKDATEFGENQGKGEKSGKQEREKNNTNAKDREDTGSLDIFAEAEKAVKNAEKSKLQPEKSADESAKKEVTETKKDKKLSENKAQKAETQDNKQNKKSEKSIKKETSGEEKAEKVDKKEDSEKQPWEMTLTDWNKEDEVIAGNQSEIVPHGGYVRNEETKKWEWQRGRNINSDKFLRRIDSNRNPISEWFYLKRTGRKLLTEEQHRRAVLQALSEGEHVPEEVLKEYPELSKTKENEGKDAQFRIIGETGASRMKNAEMLLDDLRVAREMEADFNERPKRLEKLRNSEPIKSTGEEYKGKYELNRKSAQDWALSNLRTSYIISDTGEKVRIHELYSNIDTGEQDIELSKKGAKKVVSHSLYNENHLKTVALIPALLENSIFISEASADKSDAHYEKYRYYVVGLTMDDIDYTVRITIGVKNGKYYYDHYLTDIEKTKLIDYANQSVKGFTPTGDAPIPSYTVSKDSKLLSILQIDPAETAKTIRLATGWERGADGKWRYETPDEKFTPEFVESLEKSSERYIDKRTQESYATVEDIYGENSELLKIYPSLAEALIKINIHPDNDNGGYFKKGTKGDKYAPFRVDEIGVTATSIENAQAILIHEIQHAIQDIEGFATGGNLEEAKEKLRIDLYEFREENPEYNELYYAKEDAKHLVDKAKAEEASEKAFKLSVKLKEKNRQLWEKFNELYDRPKSDAYKTYLRFSGEAEARNAQARSHMTPEERRNTLLAETEDIARDQQIVFREVLGRQLFAEQSESDEVALKAVETLFEQADIPIEYTSAEEAQRKFAEVKARESEAQMRFADTSKEFDRIQKEAVANKGLVMPDLNSASVEVVSVPKHDFIKSEKGLIHNAKEWAKNNLIGTHDAKDFKYEISNNAVSKFLSTSSIKKSANLGAHLSVLKSLPLVINKSIETEVHPDYIKKDGVRSVKNGYNDNLLIHRFYGAAEIDGKMYRVKTTINEYKGKQENRAHSYEVTKIELLDVPMAGVKAHSQQVDVLNSSTELNSPNSASGGLSIETTKLLQGVEKSYDKGKYLLDESKNAPQFHTGWHGSPHSFKRFSFEHIGTGEGAQAYGWGAYISDLKDIAMTYTKSSGLTRSQRKLINRAITIANRYSKNKTIADKINNELSYTLSDDKFDAGIYASYDGLWYNVFLVDKKSGGIIKTFSIDDLSFGGKYDINKKSNLYKVKIHGDKTIDELNFMRWDKPVSDVHKAAFFEQARQEKVPLEQDIWSGKSDVFESGNMFYDHLAYKVFNSPKEASLFLLRAGIDGIQYPTEYMSRGEHEESFNYVVFDENALEIEQHTQFFTRSEHTEKGKGGAPIVYGWTENGKVYLVKENLNPETPIHEYSHIWDIALQENNPELWKHGVELLKQTKLWDEVKNDPNYSHLKTDDQIASEVKARLTGKKGAEVFTQMQQEANNTGDVMLVAKVTKLINDIKKWLADTWYWVKDTMTNWSKEDIQRVTLDDFVNMTLADMAKGKKLEAGKQKAEAGLNEGAIFTVAREALERANKKTKKDVGKENITNFANKERRYGKGNQTGMDHVRAMGSSSINRLVGEQQKRSGTYRTIQAANEAGSVSPILTVEEREELESRGINPYWERPKFLSILKSEAQKNGVWLERDYLADKTLEHDQKELGTSENDVYVSADNKTVTKLNNLSYVKGSDAKHNLFALIDRLDAHNTLFPSVAYTIRGFMDNKNGSPSIVLEQPFVSGVERNATQEEINEYLTSKGFKLSGIRSWSNNHEVWSNGEYELFDARPANVLKGKNGELYFIDTIPHKVGFDTENTASDIQFHVSGNTKANEPYSAARAYEHVVRRSKKTLFNLRLTDPNVGYWLKEGFQDSMLSLKIAQEAIAKETGSPYRTSKTLHKMYEGGLLTRDIFHQLIYMERRRNNSFCA